MLVEKWFLFLYLQEENEKPKQASAISALESFSYFMCNKQAGIHFAKLPGY